MTEKAPLNHEKFETLPTPETHEMLPSPEQAEPLRPGEADPVELLEQARDEIESQAAEENPLERLEASENASNTPAPLHVNRELKDLTLSRELKQIQRKLKTPDRVLSKVVHQPLVRAVSEVSGKTLARPSGLLGGSLLAFLGTTSYLFYARHIGLQYNYLVFLLLFFGGFAIGLMLELVIWTFTRRHSSN
jgi:hypothetical protein